MKEEAGKSVRMLLPIKTRDGNIKKRVNVENIYQILFIIKIVGKNKN